MICSCEVYFAGPLKYHQQNSFPRFDRRSRKSFNIYFLTKERRQKRSAFSTVKLGCSVTASTFACLASTYWKQCALHLLTDGPTVINNTTTTSECSQQCWSNLCQNLRVLISQKNLWSAFPCYQCSILEYISQIPPSYGPCQVLQAQYWHSIAGWIRRRN